MVSFVLRASLAVLAIIAPALAAPTTKMVMTPGGPRPADTVHHIPAGGSVKHVANEIHLLDASGKVLHVAQHDVTSKAKKPYPSGWTAYTSWYNSESNGPINNFVTSWTVPDTPQSSNGQTVFLFNSIEPASGSAILQPVLQWGGSAAGGGTYWAIASWYVSSSTTYYSSLYNVNTGDELTGVITLTAQNGDSFDYTSSFTNNPSASVTLSASPELVWATETLECYDITTASDYPDGSTQFNNIQLSGTGGTPSFNWQVTSDDADGVTASVDADGGSNGAVTITY